MAGTGSEATIAHETLRARRLVLRNRLLADLVVDGLLRFDGDHLVILDVARLVAVLRR